METEEESGGGEYKETQVSDKEAESQAILGFTKGETITRVKCSRQKSRTSQVPAGLGRVLGDPDECQNSGRARSHITVD